MKRSSGLFAATALALTTAVISGFSNFVGKVGVSAVKDPIVFTTLKNAVVAIGLVGLLLMFRQWKEFRVMQGKQWLTLAAIGVVGGSVPFALFFSGLAKTSALNASLIHKTLFLWVLLLAVPLLKERMSKLQWFGIGLVAAANMVVGGFAGFKFNAGELMILVATILWAIENVIAKVALKDLSATTVASARMVLGSAILGAFVLMRGGSSVVVHLNATQWSWTLLSSSLLLGYVLTWYAALKRAPATYVATLLVPATLVTNVLSAIFITHSLPLVQAMNAALVTLGMVFLVLFPRKVLSESPSRGLAAQEE